MNDMISLDIICSRTSVSMETAQNCLRAEGVPIHSVLINGSKMTLCEAEPAYQAIARQREVVDAMAQAKDLAAAIVERLAPKMGQYLQDLIGENTRSVREIKDKTQRVVDTVIQQCENIVGMQRKSNDKFDALHTEVENLRKELAQSVRWNSAVATSLMEMEKMMRMTQTSSGAARATLKVVKTSVCPPSPKRSTPAKRTKPKA